MNILFNVMKYLLISVVITFSLTSNVSALQKFGTNVRVLDETSVQLSVWGNGYAMQASLEDLIFKQAAHNTLEKGFHYFSLNNSFYSTEKSNAKFVSNPEQSEISEIKFSTNRDGKVIQRDDAPTQETVSIIYDRYLLSTIVKFSDANSSNASNTVYRADDVLNGTAQMEQYFNKSNNAVASTALTIRPPTTQLAAVNNSQTTANIDTDQLMEDIDKAFSKQQWDEVVRLASKAINSDPSNHIAYSTRAGALAELHLLEDALWDVNNAIELKPDYKNSYHNRAYIYSLLGQQKNAVLNYKTACDLGIGASCKEYDDTLNTEKSQPKVNVLSVNTLLALTDKAFAQKKWLDAIGYSSEIIKQDPANHIALNNRSGALAEINLPNYALRDVEYAIALQPKYQNSYHNRGYIYALLNDNQRSVADYQTACGMGVNVSCGELDNLTRMAKLDTTQKTQSAATPAKHIVTPEVQKLLAATDKAFSTNQWADVVRLSSTILDQDPGNYQAYSNRSGALAELGLLEDALRDANKAIFLQPEYVNSYHNLGFVYALMDDNTSASINYKSACDKGVEISCKEFDKLNNEASNVANKPITNINTLVAQIATETNKKEWYKVVKTATAIIQQDSMSPQAFSSRSFALAQVNLLSYALRDADHAITLGPDYKESYASRGYVYAQLDDQSRAKSDYKKACDLGVAMGCDQYNVLTGNTQVAEAKPVQPENSKAKTSTVATVSELLTQTDAAFSHEQWNKVITLSDQILQQDAGNFVAFSNRSGALAEIGDYDRALDDVNQALALNENYKNAYHNRAYIHSLMDNNLDASNDYKKACDLGIKQSCNELDKLTTLMAKAEEENNAESAILTMPSVADLLAQTDTAFGQQKWDVVIGLSTKIINQDRSNFLAYSNRAGGFAEKGKLEQALKDINKSIALNEEYSNAYHNRAYIHSLMKNNTTAQVDYQKACDLGVSASCEEVTKLTAVASAEKEQKPAANNKGVNASIVILLAASDNAFAKKQWTEVVKLSTEIIKRDPKNYLAYSNRSGALAEQGYLNDALTDVNEAIALNPEYNNAYHNRGYIYSLLNDNKSASLNYKTACDRGINVSCEEYGKLSSVAEAALSQ